MRKIYYYVQLKTLSPLNISNGNSNHTDMDVLKDEEGCFYIPGTSIAGACYHDLDDNSKLLFNPLLKDQNIMSPIFFSDAYMVDSEKVNYEVRDGIQVNHKKVSVDGSKFNYEIVPMNTKFVLRIEVTDYNDDFKYEEMVEKLLAHIKNQDIKLGAKTTRGLGAISIEKCGKKVFDKNNFATEYFEFDCENENQYEELHIENIASEKYVVVRADLQQVGGISIRSYNTIKNEADYSHICSNGNPVIPASSWNGLIRHAFNKYANMFEMPFLTDEVFGKVNGEEKQKSKLFVEESVLTNGFEMETFRNSINRFHAKTMNTGLFREKSYYDGKTTLIIRIDKKVKHLDLVVKILEAILADINDGALALGGLTSIGRGIFTVSNVKITGMEDSHDER